MTGNPKLLAEISLARLAQVKVRVMFAAGHWVQYEKAEEVNQLLGEWLTLPPVKKHAS